MGEEIIDFRDITYSKAIEIVSPDVVLEERKKYNRDKIKLKRIIFQYYYHGRYFEGTELSLKDRKLLMSGYSPIDIDEHNHEVFRYSIHHIIPLNCNGKTESMNLIPLPNRFHDFIHEKIITPQIYGYNVGDKLELYGLPDFSKISLQQMQDEDFIRNYHKFIVDYYGIIPVSLLKIKKKSRKDKFQQWYRRMFERQKN